MGKLAQSHQIQAGLYDSQEHQLEEDVVSTKVTNTRLEAQLTATKREKDDLHSKLQQALAELAQKRVASRNLLQSKVQTLDTALEATKEEIDHEFVDGFSATFEQFQAVYPDLDQSKFDPFKVVVDGKIVEE